LHPPLGRSTGDRKALPWQHKAGPLADCATDAARNTAVAAGPLRVGIIDSSYDSMPRILHEVQARYPRPAHPPG